MISRTKIIVVSILLISPLVIINCTKSAQLKQQKREKLSLESRVAELEVQVRNLTYKTHELEEKINNPQFHAKPLK